MDKDPPEILLGNGKSQIALRGREAIRAGGSAVWYFLMARALQALATAALLSVAGIMLVRGL